MDERRAVSRQLSCIPAYVEAKDTQDEGPHLALIHDVSPAGALLFTRSELDMGEAVTLTLYLTPDQHPPRVAAGKIVRVIRRPIERSDVWQWEVGVEFDESIEQYASEIEELTRRQRQAGVLKGDA
jgi:hypothetical protein